jgi:4-carboxymuconolactone decarboxylase
MMRWITRVATVTVALATVSAAAAAQDVTRRSANRAEADRMPPIPADKLTAAQQAAITEFKAARSVEISGPFVPLLRSPEAMTRTRALGDYMRYRSALPPRLSEFVILLTARQWTQNYEWNAHAPIAREAGLSSEIIAAIAEGRRPSRMAADEEVLYTLHDELHRTHAVADATYARAVAAFGEQGVVDALGITGYYTLLAMVMNTARTPMPAGATAALAPLPK